MTDLEGLRKLAATAPNPIIKLRYQQQIDEIEKSTALARTAPANLRKSTAAERGEEETDPADAQNHFAGEMSSLMYDETHVSAEDRQLLQTFFDEVESDGDASPEAIKGMLKALSNIAFSTKDKQTRNDATALQHIWREEIESAGKAAPANLRKADPSDPPIDDEVTGDLEGLEGEELVDAAVSLANQLESVINRIVDSHDNDFSVKGLHGAYDTLRDTINKLTRFLSQF